MQSWRSMKLPGWFVCAMLIGGCAATRSDKPQADSSSDRSNGRNATPPKDTRSDGGGNGSGAPQHSPPDENAMAEVAEENYPSGALWKRTEGKRAKDGDFIPDGVTTTWYESGVKWSETTFRDGIKHGPRRTWYTTGSEWSNGSYAEDIEDGTWTAYHPNGEIARQWHIDHGTWQGAYTEFHPNGRKRMEVTFVDGIRQGVMNLNDENGKMIAFTDFIDGVEQP